MWHSPALKSGCRVKGEYGSPLMLLSAMSTFLNSVYTFVEPVTDDAAGRGLHESSKLK